MRTQQIVWNSRAGWTSGKTGPGETALVLYFGTRAALACGRRYRELRGMFPRAHILGCSTSGRINNNDVSDDEIVAAAIGFDATGSELGTDTPRLGFYSYGKNSPHANSGRCELHNQTMTVISFAEIGR